MLELFLSDKLIIFQDSNIRVDHIEKTLRELEDVLSSNLPFLIGHESLDLINDQFVSVDNGEFGGERLEFEYIRQIWLVESHYIVALAVDVDPCDLSSYALGPVHYFLIESYVIHYFYVSGCCLPFVFY